MKRRPAVLAFLAPLVILITLQLIFAAAFALSELRIFGKAFGLNGLLDVARTCGTVLAALTGILITILVFALQIQSSRLPGASLLLLAFAKREKYLPILGFNLNTILVCLIVVAFARPIQGPALAGLALATFIETAIAIIFLMYLTYRTIYCVGTVSAEELLEDHLKAQHAESLISAVKNEIALQILRNQARALGFTFAPFHSAMVPGEVNHYVQGGG